jgi:glutamyl-tRNA synthetase
LTIEGDSKRKLSERKDPGASVGCYIEQGFPADAIQYHLRGLANGQPAETPLDEALASASIPQFGWPGRMNGLDLLKLISDLQDME